MERLKAPHILHRNGHTHSLSLSTEEFRQFFPAVLAKYPAGFHLSTSSPETDVITLPDKVKSKNGEGEIVFEKISTPEAEGKENPFYGFLLRQLPWREQQALLAFQDHGGSVFMIRRTQSSKEFKNALVRHSETHHGGFAPITEAYGAYFALTPPDGHEQNEETDSFQELQRLSQKKTPIHFVAVKENGIPEEVSHALQSMNDKADPYEFVYDLYLTMSDVTKSQIYTALGIVGAGAAFPFAFQGSAHTKGTMMLSQLTGEVLTSILNRADTLIHERPDLRLMFSQLGVSIAKLKEPENLLPLMSLAASVGYAVAASNASAHTGNPAMLLSVAPVNATMLATGEILSRSIKAKHTLDQYSPEYQALLMQLLSDNTPSFMQPILASQPAIGLAMLDFAENRPAVFAALGTFASAAFLEYVNYRFPGAIPLEWMEALSGFLIENAFAIGGGMTGRKDPWDKFTRYIGQITQPPHG